MEYAEFNRNCRNREVIELTKRMLHKYYCENDVESLIELFDDEIVWFGAGEEEYAFGTEIVTEIFRRFTGHVPKCNITDQEYHVLQISPESYLCSGRLWITTDVSAESCLRVHQRITTIFRTVDTNLRCCHIHISNPYEDMKENDIGFPTTIGYQSYKFLQEQIEEQKKKIAVHTEILKQMSYKDTLTGVYNQNKFNVEMHMNADKEHKYMGLACFDINGLKAVNDQFGHSAGNALICCAAGQIQKVFDKKVYRVGGDEFVVIDYTRTEEDFYAAIDEVRDGMKKRNINCAVGISWRSEGISVQEQFDEADRRMYEEKKSYYIAQGKPDNRYGSKSPRNGCMILQEFSGKEKAVWKNLK